MAESIALSGVSVRLGPRLALDNVDFSATRGAITAVVGPNGSGKTTLLRASSGLLPYVGQIRLEGIELSELSALERAKRVSYLPQRSLLNAALSVEEVVAQGRYCHHPGYRNLDQRDRRAVARAIAEVDLSGYEGRLFNALSGGEQRRVLLGRALATEAPLLLLDEPTAALDVRHALELHTRLQALAAAGRTVIAVLHQLDDALRFANDVLLLNAGNVVAFGPASAIITQANVRAIYGVEVRENAGMRFDLEEREGFGLGNGTH